MKRFESLAKFLYTQTDCIMIRSHEPTINQVLHDAQNNHWVMDNYKKLVWIFLRVEADAKLEEVRDARTTP